MSTLVGKSMPTDPVCGMEIGEDLQFKSNSGGKTIYYFCCPHCKLRFDKDPAKFNAQSCGFWHPSSLSSYHLGLGSGNRERNCFHAFCWTEALAVILLTCLFAFFFL